jgi:ABC-2 type transport system permease protein
MKTMKWLLRREFWEHKGSFFWTPIVIAAVMVVSVAGSLAYAIASHSGGYGHVVVNGVEMTKGDLFAAAVNAIPAEKRAAIVHAVAGSYIYFGLPLFLVMAALVFFYCLSALNDERRDRSIFFWKSLPVSDEMTVLSKVLAAACVVPVITMAVATLTGVTMLIVACVGLGLKGINLAGPLLTSVDLYLAPFRLLALLPVYILWALPTIGWLLMVSAWARSKVFLWAVGIPVIAMVIVKWLDFMLSGAGLTLYPSWFGTNIVLRILGGTVPGAWLAFENVSPRLLQMAEPGAQGSMDAGAVFAQSWLTLTGPSVWIGAAAGCAMIYAAMRLRSQRGEG